MRCWAETYNIMVRLIDLIRCNNPLSFFIHCLLFSLNMLQSQANSLIISPVVMGSIYMYF